MLKKSFKVRSQNISTPRIKNGSKEKEFPCKFVRQGLLEGVQNF
jgi:ribosomal protein S30